MGIVRKHILFTGQVQGVGFRWRARQAAAFYDLTGWVKNCFDGSVEMEIQGEEDHIYKMITAINKSRYITIEDYEMRSLPVDPRESGFRVAGY